MKQAEDRLHAAVGLLVLAVVALALGTWFAGGYVSGGLAVAVFLCVGNVAKASQEKRHAREEVRPAAEDFARALAALQQKKARGRQSV